MKRGVQEKGDQETLTPPPPLDMPNEDVRMTFVDGLVTFTVKGVIAFLPLTNISYSYVIYNNNCFYFCVIVDNVCVTRGWSEPRYNFHFV